MKQLTSQHLIKAWYELNKKLTVARGKGFIFNQINKPTIKIYSNLPHINYVNI